MEGPTALDGLQRLAASDLDVEPGRVVYTVLPNERGGIEMDPTVTRLAEDRFLVLAPTLYQRTTLGLLRAGLPEGAVVTDVTSAFAVLHVAGPAAREVLGPVVDADLADAAFPFLAAREVEAGYAPALALRVSFTGELGWELYVPTEFAADVYDRIVAAGASVGLRHAGAYRVRRAPARARVPLVGPRHRRARRPVRERARLHRRAGRRRLPWGRRSGGAP